MTTDLQRQLEKLKHGDHLCSIHADVADDLAVAEAFIAEGLRRGERCVYAGSDEMIRSVAQALEVHQVDVPQERQRGALQFLSHRDTYLRSVEFDHEQMIEFLSQSEAQALAAGFSGLRYAGEMSWLLDTVVKKDQLIEYEIRLNQFLRNSHSIILCQYENPRFDPSLIHEILRVHPQVIVDDLLCPNPYYEPPELMLNSDSAASSELKRNRVDWWVKQLKAAKKVEQDRELAEAAVRQHDEELRLSEERYRLLVETIPHMVWMTSPDGLTDFLNQRGARELGLPPESIHGWGWLELLHPDDVQRSRQTWETAVRTGKSYQNEYRVRGADGAYHWYLSQGVPLQGADGKVEKWVGTWTDIDARKRTEEALRESEEKFRNAFEHTNVAMVLTDLNHRFIRSNTAFAQMFGYTREEILKLSMEDITHPDDVAESYAHRAELISGEILSFQMEKRYIHKDGHLLWGLVNVSLVRNSEGQPRHYVGQIQDTTDRRRTEAELRKTSDVLRAVTDGTSDAVFVKDLYGRYLLFNPAAAQFVGRKVEEVIGRDDTDLFGPADAELIMERDRRVMMSGQPETEEEELTAAGVTRTYLAMKAPYRNQEGKLLGVIGISRDITDRKRAEDVLRMRDRAIQAVTQGILITDPHQPDNPIIYASPSFERLTGYAESEVLGRNCRFLQGTDTDPEAVAQLREAIHAGRDCTVEIRNYKQDGTPFWSEVSVSPVKDDHGRLTQFVGIQSDITARRNLEGQLLQSQKMEAIGQMAGGVAHDFNNLLTIILGYSEMLLDALSPDDRLRSLVEEIQKAGERSASLTRQLLAFSRKQVLAPTILDMNEVVRDTEKMLRRIIGEDVHLKTVLHPQLDNIKADRGQLEQSLLNLAVNARDAMPRGGKLTIETANIELDPSYPQTHSGVRPGHYVLLAMTDSGEGMTPEVKQRIFEPFFTTKAPGKGTGLGLAVVHGFVKQTDGHIEVYSELGHGTSIKIYLPVFEGAPRAVSSRGNAAGTPTGTETILLVEDEEAVRAFSRHVLQGCGYHVLEASNGDEALRIVAKYPETIHLLLTDVVMPGMGGRKLAEQLIALRPLIKVLYVSGYTDDAVVRHGILHDQVNFLQKPFMPLALANKIREVLKN